jgi:NADPH:quinone reductase-like Zn-dependent oxidoreductase
MKACRITAFDEEAPANIQVISDAPRPSANATHCVVQIHSAAINPVDWKIAAWGFWPTTLPFIPGYDCAGVIVELPTGYEGDLKLGDRVFTCNWGVSRHWDEDATSHGGCFAEFGAFPLHKIAKIPDPVSFDAAAASALVSLTAYQSLFECLKLQPGQRILVLGGAGAVGAFAVQFAKNIGCWVATTASPRNRSVVEEYGVDKIVDYTTANWWEDEGLKGIDCIFDAVGESEIFLHAHGSSIVRKGGSMVSIVGKMAGFEEHASNYSFVGNFILHHSGEQLKLIAEMIASGKVKVAIDSTFTLDQDGVLALFNKVKSGKSNGKNVLRII